MSRAAIELAGSAAARTPAWRALASLKLSVVAIAWLAAAVAYSFDTGAPATWSLAAPLTLIAVNLGAAIATNPAFRAQNALLVFHIALIVLVLLVALGRLTYLRGRLELTTGATFDGVLIDSEAGPWHPGRIGDAVFLSTGFEIDYDTGLRRQATRNEVRWWDATGTERRAVIGDQTPLALAGYRFYTSHNKGFAPSFTWQPAGGVPARTALHLPSYPVFQYGQTASWTLPGTARALEIELVIDEVLIALDRPSRFRLPDRHVLQVSVDGKRVPLAPGAVLTLTEGALRYEGLTTWMGYTVHYDRTLPWLLASALVATGALGWHFYRKFAAQPWNAT